MQKSENITLLISKRKRGKSVINKMFVQICVFSLVLLKSLYIIFYKMKEKGSNWFQYPMKQILLRENVVC